MQRRKQRGHSGLGTIGEVREALDQMMGYLNGVAWYRHKFLIMPTGNSAMAYSLDMAEAAWARQSLSRIYWLQNDDKLPAPKMPWSRRRTMLVNQRDALIRLGIQMEGAIRRTDQEIVDAVAAEGAVLKAAWDPIVTKEELVMLNDDWTNWVNTEKDAREWKARFAVVLDVAKKNIEALSQIIKAGDLKEK
jgi:hypothetical protein